jgi:hypothetical protein
VYREANAPVKTRHATPTDVAGVAELLAGTASAQEFAADFQGALENSLAAVSLWQVLGPCAAALPLCKALQLLL